MDNLRKPNRVSQQDRKGKGKIKNTHDTKQQNGTMQILEDQKINNEDYDLSWFHPTEKQQDIIYSMDHNLLTAIQGSSGTGKSTTVLWKALSMLKEGRFRQLVFIKNPTEDGDDKIGYLTGDADTKLSVHFEAMKSIFYTFMSKAKLEMEVKRERIVFSIPNFIAGKTLDNTILILDESQKFSPNTMKLLLERCGQNTIAIVLGDKNQRYAVKKRDDGFTDFLDKITTVDNLGRQVSSIEDFGFVKMTAADNMRSELSQIVVSLYEEE